MEYEAAIKTNHRNYSKIKCLETITLMMFRVINCHSWKPCKLSGFDFFIETPTPASFPKPPLPNKVSDSKFLVAVIKSTNLNCFRLGIPNNCPLGYDLFKIPLSSSEN